MARLPQPGGDKGNWGGILNDFLAQAHNADGTLKDTGVVAAKYSLPGGGIPKTDLSAAVQASLDNADAAVSGSVPDATAGVKGKVQLAGDLGGTAALPTVPGLATKEPTITAGSIGQYWRGDKSWQTLDKSTIGLSNVDDTSDANKPVSTATQTALNTKAPTSRTITAGTGLTGGGDLSADRTLTVAYGTASGTAAEGNDSRITGAAQKSSNLSDLVSTSTARTNLGLGDSATKNVGAIAGTVMAGDDARVSGTDISSLPAAVAVDGTEIIPVVQSGVTKSATGNQISGLVNTSIAGKLSIASNLSDLNNTTTARTNLGLGNSATLNTGTGAGTVAAGDDSRITGAAQKSSNLSDLASLSTARTNLGLNLIDTDNGVSFTNTTSDTSVLSSPLTIPANTLAANDVLELRVFALMSNGGSGGSTFEIKVKFNSTIVTDVVTASLVNTTFFAWLDIRATIFVYALSPSPSIFVSGVVTPGATNGFTATTPVGVIGGTSLALPTTSDITIDVTGKPSLQHNSTGMTGQFATLYRVARA